MDKGREDRRPAAGLTPRATTSGCGGADELALLASAPALVAPHRPISDTRCPEFLAPTRPVMSMSKPPESGFVAVASSRSSRQRRCLAGQHTVQCFPPVAPSCRSEMTANGIDDLVGASSPQLGEAVKAHLLQTLDHAIADSRLCGQHAAIVDRKSKRSGRLPAGRLCGLRDVNLQRCRRRLHRPGIRTRRRRAFVGMPPQQADRSAQVHASSIRG